MRQVGYKTVRRMMKSTMKSPVSKGAVLKMQSILSAIINKITIIADNLLEEENIFREKQGLPRKIRLANEYVQRAFEQLLNSHKSLPITAYLEQNLEWQEEAKKKGEEDEKTKNGDMGTDKKIREEDIP